MTVQTEPDTIAEARRLLNMIGDPCSVAHGTPMGLEEMGLIESLELDDEGVLRIRMRLTSPTCMMVGYFKVQAEDRLIEVPGVEAVEIEVDHGLDWRPEMISASARRRRREAMLAQGIPGVIVDAA